MLQNSELNPRQDLNTDINGKTVLLLLRVLRLVKGAELHCSLEKNNVDCEYQKELF